MNYEKAIKHLKELYEISIEMQNAGITEKGNEKDLSIKCGIKALEEIQEYKSIGTVEDCKTAMKFYKDNDCELRSYRAIGTSEELYISHRNLKRYEEIGTPEECRAAMEKQKAKKPELECGTRTWADCDGNFRRRIDKCYICPSCEIFLGYVSDCKDEQCQDDYCRHCGQVLLWDCERDTE